MKPWGTCFWRAIHLLAMQENVSVDFLNSIRDYIPCDECKNEWEDLTIDESAVDWSIRLHNKVNKKLNKYAFWTKEDFDIAHKNICDICEGKEHIFNFPWGFIHSVGENPDSVSFLKSFNNEYPCNVCKNTFLTSDPESGESVIDWTVRHHKRFNEERGLSEYIHSVSIENATEGDCPGSLPC